MIKKFQIAFDILMLNLVLGAEGSRFFNFFWLLSGSEVSALIFAIAVSLIIVYLSLGGYDITSKLSVIICIGLSVISYIDPFVKEVMEVDFTKVKELEKSYIDTPKFKSKWESKEDKEISRKSYLAELEKVEKHNSRIDSEILKVGIVSKTKMIAFIFSAFLMSFCVPLLTYLISHKLSKEFTGVIESKREKEDIQNIFNKLGGKKI